MGKYVILFRTQKIPEELHSYIYQSDDLSKIKEFYEILKSNALIFGFSEKRLSLREKKDNNTFYPVL